MTSTGSVILLTGAGSSALVGLKTLKSIVDGIQGVHVPLDSGDSGVELVKEAWKMVKGQEGEKATLESLLGRLKLYSQFADILRTDHVFSHELRVDPPYVAQFKSKWENALAYCFRLMLHNYGPQQVQVDSPGYKLIQQMLQTVANGNALHLFTTNYDCLFNVMAAHARDLSFMSHINNKDGAFGSKWFRVNEKTFRRENARVYLHRLHGCVGWFSDPQSPYGVHEVFGSGNRLEIQDQEMLNQMAIKLVTSAKIGSIPAFSLAFQEFARELERCDCLLVWGHSFRDLEVLRCMINVAKSRKEKPYRILCIEPYLNADQIQENIRSTIAGVPELSSGLIKPEIIEWVIQDGYGALLERVESSLRA
jgi:hypothetical protein